MIVFVFSNPETDAVAPGYTFKYSCRLTITGYRVGRHKTTCDMGIISSKYHISYCGNTKET